MVLDDDLFSLLALHDTKEKTWFEMWHPGPDPRPQTRLHCYVTRVCAQPFPHDTRYVGSHG